MQRESRKKSKELTDAVWAVVIRDALVAIRARVGRIAHAVTGLLVASAVAVAAHTCRMTLTHRE